MWTFAPSCETLIRMNRTALLAGYYGFGNTGDEAILAALVAGLSRREPSSRLVVLSGDPEDTRRRHGVPAIAWRDVEALSAEVAQTDLVILGGGGLFQDYWGFDPEALLSARAGGVGYYSGPAALAALYRKPSASTRSASARSRPRPPPATRARLRRRVRDHRPGRGLPRPARVARRRRVARRDHRGRRVRALRAPARAAGGPRGLGRRAERPGSRRLAAPVVPRRRAGGVGARDGRALDLFLDRTGGAALFLPFERSPWSREDDIEISLRVRKRMRRGDRAAVLTEPRPPDEAAGLLAGCDAVLGMRLHALNLACAAGVPVVGIAYDPKITALLGRLGFPDMGVAPAQAEARGLFDRLTRALDERGAISARLKDEAARMRRLAEEDLDAAARMLADPPAPPGSATR
jgi:hypothetical protein